MNLENEELIKLSKEKLIDIIEELNDKSEVAGGKFGLVWDKEKEPEKIVAECNKNIPVLEAVQNKDINFDNGMTNILIEGDNFHSLSILNYTHQEKIDVIYIDPPYNTGNKDFVYNDKFVDIEDGYRHSKWLNFMEKRLKLARRLLKDTGVIFISIDDNELFQLKLLCDRIFGESNYINTISVKMKNNAGASGGGEDKRFKKNIEQILIYSKNITQSKPFNNVYSYIEISELLDLYRQNGISWKYTSIIKDFGKKEYCCSTYDGNGDEIRIYKVKDAVLTSISSIVKEEKISDEEVYYKYFDSIYTTAMPQSSIRPRVLNKIIQENLPLNDNSIYSIEYIPKSGKNKGTIYEQYYKGEQMRLFTWFRDVANKNDGKVYKREIKGTYWDGYNLNNLTKEGNVKFENGKKPVKLIQDIIEMSTDKESVVLDFFAGSGTTGHAVLETNKKDNGNRQYILCTNNEQNICEEVTYQRLKNVIEGYADKEPLGSNLKYFRTAFVENSSNRDQFKYDLTEKCIPMLYMKENTFELVKATNEYQIYTDKNKGRYTCVYFEMFGNKYEEFIKELEGIEAPKSLYIFSLSDFVDEESLSSINNYSVEPIPHKIIDLYKKIIKLSKEE